MSRSLPYPEMAVWYITLKFYCNSYVLLCVMNRQCFISLKFSSNDHPCENTSILLQTRLSSSACTRDFCGTYGVCRLLTSQQNLYSTCTCIAGFRGYGCTDDSQSFLWKFLPSVLFLTLSNLLFIPAIIMSIYYRLYSEALIYFFNMFFSTVKILRLTREKKTSFVFFSFITRVIKICLISACLNTMDYN